MKKALVLVGLLLAATATPSSAYRFLGIGQPSKKQRPSYRHFVINGRTRWAYVGQPLNCNKSR